MHSGFCRHEPAYWLISGPKVILTIPDRGLSETRVRSRQYALCETDTFMLTGPNFEKTPLIPVIAQDDATGDVLMLAWMNQEAYTETLQSGRVVYFSRSRQKLWRKGEESGNVQLLKSLYFDCDADTLLVKVEQLGGAACHEGYRSCFFRRLDVTTGAVHTEGQRVFDPAVVYKKS